jgi:hypothetical protein
LAQPDSITKTRRKVLPVERDASRRADQVDAHLAGPGLQAPGVFPTLGYHAAILFRHVYEFQELTIKR